MSVPVAPVRRCKLVVGIERDLACTTVQPKETAKLHDKLKTERRLLKQATAIPDFRVVARTWYRTWYRPQRTEA
jgi:hypothetical protein